MLGKKLIKYSYLKKVYEAKKFAPLYIDFKSLCKNIKRNKRQIYYVDKSKTIYALNIYRKVKLWDFGSKKSK